MIDAIHIGFQKTGTIWMQEYVIRQHPELIYLDDPRQYPCVVSLFYELVNACDLEFNSYEFRERLEKVIEEINIKNKKLIVSREALSGKIISGEHVGRIARRFLLFLDQ